MQTVSETDVCHQQPPVLPRSAQEVLSEAPRALTRSVSAPPRAAAEAARVAGPPVPDLEDAGLVLDRASLFRPRGLAVTDVSSAEWCQQQVAYKLTVQLPDVRPSAPALHSPSRLPRHCERHNSEERFVLSKRRPWHRFHDRLPPTL